MRVALLSIGTELTRGELIDTNAGFISEQLTSLGAEVLEHATVDDDDARIVEALQRLGGLADLVVTTGGLGPTTDDRTSACAAAALGEELVRDEAQLAHIRSLYASRGREMPETNAKQADFPSSATVLPNPVGTAPGFAVTIGGARCFFTPGVPREMKPMFAAHIAPYVRDKVERNTHQEHLRTFGLPESKVGQLLEQLEHKYEGLIVGYRSSFPEIEVKLFVRAETAEAAKRRAEAARDEAATLLGDAVYGGKNDTFASAVGTKLKAHGAMLVSAESCTGGGVGALVTSVAGSSAYYAGGVVSYSNEVKEGALGVKHETLVAHGAVSEEVAGEMAEGALKLPGATIAVSITGIAGPGGATEGKPVGTVCFGVAREGKPTYTKRMQLFGERTQFQKLASYAALRLVMRSLDRG